MDFQNFNEASTDLIDHVVRVPAIWIDDESGSIQDHCSLSAALRAMEPIDTATLV